MTDMGELPDLPSPAGGTGVGEDQDELFSRTHPDTDAQAIVSELPVVWYCLYAG
jgi:hypothetical protein